MKLTFTLFWIVFSLSARAQDLAPESVTNMMYEATPQTATTGALGPPVTAFLASNGIRYTVSLPGNPLFAPVPYSWRKTGANTGTLAIGSSGSTQLAVTFDFNGRGTYRETSAGAVVSGAIVFTPIPQPRDAPLINLSVLTRFASTTPSTQGFVVGGSTPRRVLARAIGPGLAQFGVPNPASSPTLTVFRGNVQIGANDGWGGEAGLTAAFAKAGAFALRTDSRDCAILLTLDPGNYSIQAQGNRGGVVLMEVYYIE